MGYKTSWIAFHGIDRAEGLRRLGMVDTGVPDEDNDKPYSFAELPSGWSVLWVWKPDYATPKRLAALSEGCRVIGLQAYDVVMCYNAALYTDGVMTWSVAHEGHEDGRHLEVHGDLPPDYASIRKSLETKQDKADDEGEEVDYISEIPMWLMHAATGYYPGRGRPRPRFTEVRPAAGSGGSWLSRLFGR